MFAHIPNQVQFNVPANLSQWLIIKRGKTKVNLNSIYMLLIHRNGAWKRNFSSRHELIIVLVCVYEIF